MRPDSLDLRQKIVRACAGGGASQRAVAERFDVSLSFVEKLLRCHRATGEVGPKRYARGPKPRLDACAEAAVRAWIAAQPDLTLAELCHRLAATGVRTSGPALCRALQRLGVPRKKSRSTRRSATPNA